MQGFVLKSYKKVDFLRKPVLICRLLGRLFGFEGLVEHGADEGIEGGEQHTRRSMFEKWDFSNDLLRCANSRAALLLTQVTGFRSVRLNRFLFRECDETIPDRSRRIFRVSESIGQMSLHYAEREKNVKQLFEAAKTNAQWRYRSYQRMFSTDWSRHFDRS